MDWRTDQNPTVGTTRIDDEPFMPVGDLSSDGRRRANELVWQWEVLALLRAARAIK